jgi:hypothetical protein
MPSSPSTPGDAAATSDAQAQVLQQQAQVLQQQAQMLQQQAQMLQQQAQVLTQLSQLVQQLLQMVQQSAETTRPLQTTQRCTCRCCCARASPSPQQEALQVEPEHAGAPVRLFFDGADIRTSDCFSSDDAEMPAPPSPSAPASVSAAQRRNGAPHLPSARSSKRSSADAEAQAAEE